jgi:sugar (pentulose or hexulose) kinase
MVEPAPRGIAVVDVGYTNTKVILFSPNLEVLAERKITSTHRPGKIYPEIDFEPMVAFFAEALPELDRILPVDRVVSTSHGACVASLDKDGKLAVPLMDYMVEPPAGIVQEYTERCPSYEETYSPQLPIALLHAMQLFWQKRALKEQFERVETILPLMQYVGFRLGGKPVTEVSSMGCQSHLIDMNTFAPSTLAISEGWASRYAPRANAWNIIGSLKPEFRGASFRGRGEILAGVHDSNGNYLRYLAGGLTDFTLLSTGTWIIGFDSHADIRKLDRTRDIVANVDVMGRRVACCRFFGGKEFEIVSNGVPGEMADLQTAASLISRSIMAMPSFTDSGGPIPGSASRGMISGQISTDVERATLASIYCALMVSESLDAIDSRGEIIVDGPFSQNLVFLRLLAALRKDQTVKASNLRDGTAAGTACLALMTDGKLPHITIDMHLIESAHIGQLQAYKQNWQRRLLNA